MLDSTHVVTELEEQRCLIEQQRVEIRRMQRHITLQRELIGRICIELDTLKKDLPLGRKPRTPSNGHERGRASGDSHAATSSDDPA